MCWFPAFRYPEAVMKNTWIIPLLLLSATAADAQLPFANKGPFTAKDSLDIGKEKSLDARDCLIDLAWDPKSFQVTLEEVPGAPDAVLRFPSPKPNGNAKNDKVAVEWYMAREPKGQKKNNALPVVVVHELGSNMAAGRAVAAGLSRIGFHAFMVQLPSYGDRRVRRRARPAEMLQPMQQAIADVRRARDAVLVMPTVDTSHIALQGTSLGGIIAATAGGLDKGFNSVHLVLAGGDLFTLIKTGQRDTAYVRRDLERAGVTDDELRKMTQRIEPTRVAHRLPREGTWLYSGKADTVIPMANAKALAKSAGLTEGYHQTFNANHYTGMVFLPWVVSDIAANITKMTKR